MEQFEQQPQQESNDPGRSLFQLNLDATNSYMLRNAGSWAKVTGIVGICVGALLVILSVIGLSEVSNAGSYRSRGEGFGDVLDKTSSAQLGATVLIFSGIIFIIGGVFAFSFGNKIAAALRSNDQHSLNKGFSALRNYYIVRGIALIILSLFLLMLLAAA